MKSAILAACAALLLAMAPGTVQAQTLAEFRTALSGEWQVVDALYGAAGKTCALSLSEEMSAIDRHVLTVKDCAPALAKVVGWNIIDGQVILFDADGTVAALGGNQQRLSGEIAAGAPIILDRPTDPAADQVNAARTAVGCYYLGFTDVCGDDELLEKPESNTDGTPTGVSVLVNLNARTEARNDAEVLGVVPQNTCVETNICLEASDGVWCQATFGEKTGWLKKVALRQGKWPVITFVNQCPRNATIAPVGTN